MPDSGFERTRPKVHLRIGSERVAVGSGGTFEHVDPCTGEVDGIIPLAGPTEIDRAVSIAHETFLRWRDVRPAEKRRVLWRLADLIENRAQEFVRTAVLDNATPVTTAAGLAQGAAEWARYYAGFADKLEGRVGSSFGPDGEFSYTLRQPYGVIAAIITWNGPLLSLMMKVPAALAAGNTVVVKPSEITPFGAELFADVVDEAGLPAGAVSILPGTGAAGAALVENPLVQKITFTGGPLTAKAILRACSDQIKPACLELGGKSANLIFDDVDLDSAVTWNVMRTLGTLSGQGCGFPTRMLVQSSIYEEAIDCAARVIKRIRVGDPWDTETDIGPVINQATVDRILAMIDRAKAAGARLVAGGGRIEGAFANGFYIEPTLFADVDPESEIAQAEVFGPVLAVLSFSSDAEAIEIANSTSYGLSAFLQTNDVHRAHRISERLAAGSIMINRPPSLMLNRPVGGLGLSGYGKEGGPDGLAEFQRVKSVVLGTGGGGGIVG